MKEKLKKSASLLLILCLVLTVIGGSAYAAQRDFEDAKGHWAEEAIQKLTEQGAIAGFPDGLCHPNEIITRAEFATLLSRTMTEIVTVKGDSNIFADIGGNWAERNIRYLVEQKIIVADDYENKLFAPTKPITRLEMVKMLVRALGDNRHSEDCTCNLDFTDISLLEKEDQRYLCIGKKHFIIKGYPDKTAKPNGNATRGEAFEMIVITEKAKDEMEQEKSAQKPSRPSGGGGSSYVPAPEFRFVLPENSYVGDEVKITPTAKYVSTVSWSVTKNESPVELSSAFKGELTKDGGTLTAKGVGKYTITATAKNSRGREITLSQSVTVYPVVSMKFTLPESAHTDTAIPVELKTENLRESKVVWSVTKDKESIDLSKAIAGELTNVGGAIQFKEQGGYTLTASITDALGKVTTLAQNITVYPVAEVKLTLPSISHMDKTVTLTVESKSAEGMATNWTLTKDGKSAELGQLIDGKLSLSDSGIRFKEKGVYQLTVIRTDITGREFTDTAKITVYPVGAVGFYLPSILHTDDSVKVETTLSQIGEKTATWTVTKNGKETPLFDCVSGTLTNDGGNIHFKEKGKYVLKCSFADDGGRAYSYEQTVKVYPVPTVTYTQPKFVHTDTEVTIKNTSTDLHGLSLEWLVDNTFGYQDRNTFVSGNLSNDGGNIHFKRAGIYELVARTTDETGRVFLFEPKNKTEVLPVLTLDFTLPEVAYTDTPIDIRTSGHNNTLPVEWTLSKNGESVELSSAIDASLNRLGGKVRFTAHGEYVLTAKMMDLLDRSYSHSESISIMPIVEYAFTMPSNVHYGNPFEVATSKSLHSEKADVVWTLSKNGESCPYVGVLTKTGGTIEINGTGDFVLTAVAIDSLGRECRCSQNITITNTLPVINEIQAVQTRTVKDGKFLVNISANTTDADGDATTLEWQGRTEGDYYAVGTHTIQVRAKDSTGAFSDWESQTFTVANSAPTRPVITRNPTENSVVPGTPVTITASSSDADGDAITYVWEGRQSETDTYPLGKNTVRVKTVDETGAESPWAAIVFFVMDSNGSGGMMLTGTDSTINESGIEGATITKYTFNVPAVSGHSGNDYGRVRGYNVLTKQWDQLDYETTINGISFTRNLSSGMYSKLEFYYYTNHNCMYNKSNITYTVEYYFE